MLSERGFCFSFDARADGYSRADGCLANVFCRIPSQHDLALAAATKATAVLQDGPSASLTAPNGAS